VPTVFAEPVALVAKELAKAPGRVAALTKNRCDVIEIDVLGRRNHCELSHGAALPFLWMRTAVPAISPEAHRREDHGNLRGPILTTKS
jgi:hypothetical protein